MKPPAASSAAYAMLAIMIGVMGVPATTTALFPSVDDDGTNVVPVVDLRQSAAEDAARVRNNRRDYWRAIEVYKKLVHAGITGLTPPVIDEPDTIAFYLDEQTLLDLEAQFEAPPLLRDIAVMVDGELLEYRLLPEQDQDLLNGYVETGSCSATLKWIIPAYGDGLYQLCLAMLDAKIAATRQTLLDRSIHLRGYNPVGYAPIRNLRRRLELLEESLNVEGAAVRPRTHSGFRPRQPDADTQ